MTDSRLSADPCSHICCTNKSDWGHDEPGHLHLFSSAECPMCRVEASKHRHPSTDRRNS